MPDKSIQVECELPAAVTKDQKVFLLSSMTNLLAYLHLNGLDEQIAYALIQAGKCSGNEDLIPGVFEILRQELPAKDTPLISPLEVFARD